MATIIRQEINLLTGPYSGANAVISCAEQVQLNTAAYSGSIACYFEVEGSATAGSNGSIRLRRVGTTTDDATFTSNNFGTGNTLYRTAAFTPPAGATAYFIYADAGGAGKTITLKAARIVIIQTSDPIASTETQIEVGGQFNTTSLTGAPNGAPKYWKYTSANWDGVLTCYVEAVLTSPATKSESFVKLQVADGSGDGFTGWANVTNGTVGTTAGVPTWVRSSTPFIPIAGRNYRIVGASCASKSAMYVYCAKIVICQGAWTEQQPVGNVDKAWISVGISSDGTKFIAAVSAGRLYTYNGSIWIEQQPAGAADKAWKSVGISSDGTKFIAAIAIGRLYTYNGVTWTEQQPAGAADKEWQSVGISSDGTKFIASVYNGRFYTFNGATWTEQQPAGDFNKYWRSVGISSDGTKFIAGAGSGRLYTFDGATWIEQTPAGAADKEWLDVGISSDGTKFIATAYGFRFYTKFPVDTTKLEPQYLLANKALAAGTGLQTFLTKWDSAEWSGVTNVYQHAVDAANDSTSHVTLDQADGGGAVTGSEVVHPDNQGISGAMTMPASENLDVTATVNNGDVYASRILVLVVVAAGTQYPQDLTAAMASLGATLNRGPRKGLAAGLASLGAVCNRRPGKVVTAGLAFLSASVNKRTNTAMAASLAALAVECSFVKISFQELPAGLPALGAELNRRSERGIAAGLGSLAGGINKQIRKLFTGG